ncbi:hypothetical protein [Mesorhizobium sp. M0276]|uniref:hypothetical protein n=1 Tax=Mesorhizobium sp. M0276 TaxID=2956928 RepID=UPI00333511D4
MLENDGSRCGLLVENKIRAIRMARQFERYRMRGDEGVAKELWDTFLVILAAPQRYVDALLAEEKDFLNGYLTYEWIVAWLVSQDETRHAFKIHVMREAIADARAGYSKKRDTRTAFHQSVYEIATAEFPALRMAWIEKAAMTIRSSISPMRCQDGATSSFSKPRWARLKCVSRRATRSVWSAPWQRSSTGTGARRERKGMRALK